MLLLTPYFLLYDRRRVEQPSAQLAAGSELRSRIPGLWFRGPRLRWGDKPSRLLSSLRAPHPQAPPRRRPPAHPTSSRDRSRCAGAPEPRPPVPAPGAPFQVPGAPQRPGRTRSLRGAAGKISGEEEEPETPSGWSREPESSGGGFPGPGSQGLPWRLGRVTGIPLRPPWATS